MAAVVIFLSVVTAPIGPAVRAHCCGICVRLPLQRSVVMEISHEVRPRLYLAVTAQLGHNWREKPEATT